MNPLQPGQPQGQQGQQAQAQPIPAKGVAPGREVYRTVKRRLGGRELEFLERRTTVATQDQVYVTSELVDVPQLDCSCYPLHPDDIAECVQCKAVVCGRRHSRTCASCGKVVCTGCLTGVLVKGVQAIVCRPCGETLTASAVKKICKGISKFIWG